MLKLIPMIHLCECGCGKPTRLAKQTRTAIGHVAGQPVRFLNGHAVRVQPLKNLRHGMSNTPEHNAWHNAKDRCLRRNHKQFAEYGGRGIRFSFSSFEEFY